MCMYLALVNQHGHQKLPFSHPRFGHFWRVKPSNPWVIWWRFILMFSRGLESCIWVCHLDVSKNRDGKTPPNHPLKNRVFHYFHHPFWGTLIFGNTHLWLYYIITNLIGGLGWWFQKLNHLMQSPKTDTLFGGSKLIGASDCISVIT